MTTCRPRDGSVGPSCSAGKGRVPQILRELLMRMLQLHGSLTRSLPKLASTPWTLIAALPDLAPAAVINREMLTSSNGASQRMYVLYPWVFHHGSSRRPRALLDQSRMWTWQRRIPSKNFPLLSYHCVYHRDFPSFGTCLVALTLKRVYVSQLVRIHSSKQRELDTDKSAHRTSAAPY